ncbi:MAG TPA: DUF2851 family protein [Candidatus Acidoferrum sp.]|nr:DUF2851 family protein [Candidatus Acidoferrum sp.]
MCAPLSSFYAQWRVRCGVVQVLREDQDSPPERLLQTIWQHQRLRRDQLQTLDGQPLRVLHPGFRSVEGGPDFRGAIVQVGDAPPRTGDIEVDLRSSGWRAHGHDRNPAFQNVILHVIWESERPAAGAPPLLILRHVLDAPLGELSLWLGGEAAQTLPESLRGNCCAPLRQLPADQLTDLLHQAAEIRFHSKAAQFQARARQAGWEQSLWEGLFKALGYKHNVWPMQRLAELRPRWQKPGTPSLPLQARLLGISGLLPVELTRAQSGADGFVRRIWDLWWRERDEFLDCFLPKTLWRFHSLRPANHPQRRLALAAHWSAADTLPSRLEQWCARELPDSALTHSLLETLQVPPDEFWSWHFTLRSARLKKEQPLLGATRVTDLAVNVVLPWLWARATEGKNPGVQRAIQHRYFAWPAAEDNSVLRLARQRLLGALPARTLAGAAAQQGLIQMVRDFCDHSNSICESCKLPALVKDWTAQQARAL